jgi:hypothetical protein
LAARYAARDAACTKATDTIASRSPPMTGASRQRRIGDGAQSCRRRSASRSDWVPERVFPDSGTRPNAGLGRAAPCTGDLVVDRPEWAVNGGSCGSCPLTVARRRATPCQHAFLAGGWGSV